MKTLFSTTTTPTSISPTNRWHALDNIKGMMMILVVYGHILETFSFPGSHFMYLVIYSFHMPVFVFTSGLCTGREFSPAKITRHYILPYLIFQLIYCIFCAKVVGWQWSIQFFSPIWSLWYLMALILWNIMIHFIPVQNSSTFKKFAILLGSICVSLLAGLDAKIGVDFSLSRVIVFFPFFLMGRYAKDFLSTSLEHLSECKLRSCLLRIASVLSIAGILIVLYAKRTSWGGWVFYQSGAYAVLSQGLKIRAFFYVTGFLFILFFLLFTPNRKFPGLTFLGRNTLPVFLLHGFVILYLKSHPISYLQEHPIFFSHALTLAMLVILPLFSLLKPRKKSA